MSAVTEMPTAFHTDLSERVDQRQGHGAAPCELVSQQISASDASQVTMTGGNSTINNVMSTAAELAKVIKEIAESVGCLIVCIVLAITLHPPYVVDLVRQARDSLNAYYMPAAFEIEGDCSKGDEQVSIVNSRGFRPGTPVRIWAASSEKTQLVDPRDDGSIQISVPCNEFSPSFPYLYAVSDELASPVSVRVSVPHRPAARTSQKGND
ncbi:hypothetical protein [Streptomyces sp. YKOK-I1]